MLTTVTYLIEGQQLSQYPEVRAFANSLYERLVPGSRSPSLFDHPSNACLKLPQLSSHTSSVQRIVPRVRVDTPMRENQHASFEKQGWLICRFYAFMSEKFLLSYALTIASR